MSTPPPPAPDDGPLKLRDVWAAGRARPERDEQRSLRRTVQGAVVVIVALVVMVALIALAHSLNADSAHHDCVASGVVCAE